MIKRITFSPLTANSMTYTALGGVRFYSEDNGMYDIGEVILTNSLQLETTKLIATVGNSYNTAYYTLLHMLDNKLSQTGDLGTYWLTSSDNMTIDITFKEYEMFNKVEFLTKPSSSNDRGIDYTFYVRTYTGENGDVLISEDVVVPNSVNLAIQEVQLQPMYSFFSNGEANDKFKIFEKKIIKSDLKMTSNKAPLPYVAKASSEYNSTYQAFKAFNGDTSSSSSSWITTNGVKSGWLQIDFGDKKKVNSFYITSRNSNELSAPKAFKILGSDDEVNWFTLKEVRNQTNWGINETKFFYFNKVAFFRFYRLEIIEPASLDYGSVANYVAIGALDFTFDKTGITELPDTEEDTLTTYGGTLVSISQPISSYNFVLNNRTVTKSGEYWTKELKEKPLFISVGRGKEK